MFLQGAISPFNSPDILVFRMRKSEIRIGGFYDVEDNSLFWGTRRGEVVADLGSGCWQVELLDPPYTGCRRKLTSRQIVRNWISPASRVRNGQVTFACRPGQQDKLEDLSALACRIADGLERLDPRHPVEIDSLVLPHRESAPGSPGSLSLSLSEPAAKALLDVLEREPSLAPALLDLI